MTNLWVGLQEYCAGWHYIGHNSANRLLFLWIIPKYVFISATLSGTLVDYLH